MELYVLVLGWDWDSLGMSVLLFVGVLHGCGHVCVHLSIRTLGKSVGTSASL